MTVLKTRVEELDRLFDIIDKIVQVCIVAVFFILFMLLNTQVAIRYVLHIPLIWVEELAGFLLSLLTMWGSSSCIRTDGHIRVTFIMKYIPSLRWRNVFSLAVHMIMLFYLYYLVMYGYQFALMGKGEMTPSNTFDFFIPRLSLATGGILMIIQTIGVMLQEVVQLISPSHTSSRENTSS